MRIRKVSSRQWLAVERGNIISFPRDERPDRSSHPKWPAQNTCTQEQHRMHSVDLYACVNICICIYGTMIFKEEVLRLRGSGRNMRGVGEGKGKKDVKAVLQYKNL